MFRRIGSWAPGWGWRRKDRCPPQYPDSDEDPGVTTGSITRNRLQEPEAVTIGDVEDTYEHPETTDPWGITN